MGKCVSKHPSDTTAPLEHEYENCNDKDLATAKQQIWSKFAKSSEYIALKDEHGNQLCEYYYYVSNKPGDRATQCPQNQQQQQPQPEQPQPEQQEQQHNEDLIANCLKPRTNDENKRNRKVDDARNIGHDGAEVCWPPLVSPIVLLNVAVDTDEHEDDDDDVEHSYWNTEQKRVEHKTKSTLAEKLNRSGVECVVVNKYESNNNIESPQLRCFQEIQQQLQQPHRLHQQHGDSGDANNNECVNVKKSYGNHNNRVDKFKFNKSSLQYKNNDYDDDDDEVVDGDAVDAVQIGSEHSGWSSVIYPEQPQYADDTQMCFNFCTNQRGQTESKKLFKKHGAGGGGNGGGTVETKGTAMSFGFRKKLNTTPKKTKKQKDNDKQDKCNNVRIDSDAGTEQILSCGVGKSGVVIETKTVENNDSNGNTENFYFEKVGAAVAAKSQSVHQMEEHIGQRPGTGNRFGFKGTSVVRPASTGITTRYHSDECNANLENNNAGSNIGGTTTNLPYKSNLKRRSKSAHSARSMTSNQCVDDAQIEDEPPKITQPKTLTFNLNHNTIEYQRRQFFDPAPAMTAHYNLINTGIHTNVIVRPAPRPAPTPTTFSKFTLQTTSLPKPEYPVPIRVTATQSVATMGTVANPIQIPSGGARAKETIESHSHMDQKTAKQMANNTTRRGFNGSREISADSGIASIDITLGDSSASSSVSSHARHSSPKRSRSRPRNLQMVMNGRHKFEVRDLDDPLSSENTSLVEPLALPKLPNENQTVPLPLSGLVRSNTVLSREAFIKSSTSTTVKQEDNAVIPVAQVLNTSRRSISKQSSDETDSVEEEKLHIDCSTSEKNVKKQQKFRDINTCSSKTSSAASSRASSWCNAGESLAIKDCSSLSISSSEDSNKLEQKLASKQDPFTDTLNDDDYSTVLNTDLQISSISSMTTESLPVETLLTEELSAEQKQRSIQAPSPLKPVFLVENKHDRPQSLHNSLNESKFAEMAAAGSEYLLDDETSPTDSLVSSTDSDDAACKRQKHKINEEIQEKDIDEISPELELGSPISPGTPTHASHSLSLSDCGNLIDDEIADQPALLFNTEDGGAAGVESGGASHKGHSDTPTLMDTSSMRSLKSQSKARTALQQAIELSLRTPMSLRKAVMNRAESLDTLSPCESICSDDLMMDFDTNSSMDSIDKSTSIKSRSGSDLNKLDETQLFSELEQKGSIVMKDLNSLLRFHTRQSNRDETTIAHLPARATRLLNRSRLQQQCQLSSADSESPKSHQSARRANASRASTSSSLQHSGRDTHSSSDDLMLYDKSFRNAMIQDVLQFKRQLLRLRRILQEDECCQTRTETLNPFETDNSQLFASCGLDCKLLDDIDLASLTSSTTDDPLQELADLRRQVVYLQGQVDDRDRTIRLQRSLIEQLEAEKGKPIVVKADGEKECINMATQTERTRPLSIGPDGLSRSKPEYTSYTTYFPVMCSSDTTTAIAQQQQQHHHHHHHHQAMATTNPQTRRHTIISTTFTNYNHQQQQQPQQNTSARRASIAWDKATPAVTPLPITYKPVRITLIGEPMQQQQKQQHGTNMETHNNRLHEPKPQRPRSLYSNGNGKMSVEYRKNHLNGYHDDGLPTHNLKPHFNKYQQDNEQNCLLVNGHMINGNSTKSKCNQLQPTVTIV